MHSGVRARKCSRATIAHARTRWQRWRAGELASRAGSPFLGARDKTHRTRKPPRLADIPQAASRSGALQAHRATGASMIGRALLGLGFQQRLLSKVRTKIMNLPIQWRFWGYLLTASLTPLAACSSGGGGDTGAEDVSGHGPKLGSSEATPARSASAPASASSVVATSTGSSAAPAAGSSAAPSAESHWLVLVS